MYYSSLVYNDRACICEGSVFKWQEYLLFQSAPSCETHLYRISRSRTAYGVQFVQMMTFDIIMSSAGGTSLMYYPEDGIFCPLQLSSNPFQEIRRHIDLFFQQLHPKL